MKKIIFALALLATLTLSACKSNEEPEVLTIWAWNRNVDIIEDAIERYQVDHPDFQAVVVDYGKADINTKISTAAALKDSTDMADIFLGDWIYMRSNYELFPELFTDLSDYVSSDEIDKFPNFATDVVTDSEGNLFALPFGIGPTVTFGYVPLLNQAGVTNEEILDIQQNGWTWDEYYQIGQDVHALGEDYYMAGYQLANDDRIFRTMSSQKGYWFMDESQIVTVDNQVSQDSLTKLDYFYDNDIIKHIDSGDYKSLMIEGKLAAQIQGFWLSGQIKSLAEDQSGDWRILPCPSWTADTTGASITGGSYLYVNGQSENKSSAIDFIKWLTLEKDNVLRTLEVGGIFPVLSEVYSDDRFVASDDFFGTHNYLEDVSRNVSEALPIYPSKYNGFNYDTYMTAQYEVLFNEKSVADELTAAATTMRNNKGE